MTRLIVLWVLCGWMMAAPLWGQVTDQAPRKARATRVETPPVIDGAIEWDVWQQAEVMADFVEASPEPMTASDYRTEVYLLYDDRSIYVAFYCHVPDTAEVLRQLSVRDEVDNASWVSVIVNSYQDGLNGERFTVTAAGVQLDSKYANNLEDYNWDAVWVSAVQYAEDGWVVEMEIPFSALRFPSQNVQDWGINFGRNMRETREESWWNPIDPRVPGVLNQSGVVAGFEGISPPMRLFLYPYMALNADHFPHNTPGRSNWNNAFNAGMDIKYGINDAFTLDMTLIPDFGQVRSDNQVLNLSPFEVVYDENRQFFTEGTDLFNKGGLFYSRRIGARPGGYFAVGDALREGESIVANPSVVQLLNSTKVSGRTDGGLGIGFLNSITNTTQATLRDSLGNERRVQTEPFTNYNISVLDQNLRNNGFLTLINTNVSRRGTRNDDNVGGVVFQFNDKGLDYRLGGRAMHSFKRDDAGTVEQGFLSSVTFSKISGNFRFSAENSIISDQYDQNDLGILFQNNFVYNGLNLQYNIFDPFWKLNRARFNVQLNMSHRYDSGAFQDFSIVYNAFSVTRNFFAFGLDGRLEPITTYDYFEPRVDGRYLAYPRNWGLGGWLSSDYRKRFALDASVYFRGFDQAGRQTFSSRVEPRFRVSDRLMLIYSWDRTQADNDIGFVNFHHSSPDSIIMGRRLAIENVHLLNTSYIFNARTSLSFRLRHYWRTAAYNRYFLMTDDGDLAPTDYNGTNDAGESRHNISYNAFNIDCVFSWQFAPGSFLTAVWKNAIYRSVGFTQERFLSNLDNTLHSDQNNAFTLRVLYFVDYDLARKQLQARRTL